MLLCPPPALAARPHMRSTRRPPPGLLRTTQGARACSSSTASLTPNSTRSRTFGTRVTPSGSKRSLGSSRWSPASRRGASSSRDASGRAGRRRRRRRPRSLKRRRLFGPRRRWWSFLPLLGTSFPPRLRQRKRQWCLVLALRRSFGCLDASMQAASVLLMHACRSSSVACWQEHNTGKCLRRAPAGALSWWCDESEDVARFYVERTSWKRRRSGG